MESYEKLGAFFLGRPLETDRDDAAGEPEEGYLLYDSKDLTTHAMCVGMTGSGKTGLCISLLEEAAIDGVPAIAIDPKGDLGNLLLTFPGLNGEDFMPWINPREASEKGQTAPVFAKAQADLELMKSGAWTYDKQVAKAAVTQAMASVNQTADIVSSHSLEK